MGILNLWTDKNHISEENLYDGGYIVGANLDNGPSVNIKTVKALAANGHNIFLILVGCTATEIEQHMLEFKNKQKLVGIASSWRKLNCKELIEIPRERFFTSKPDDNLESPDIGQLQPCDELSKLYLTLDNHKNTSNNNGKVGVYVFFPSIPGSGKSSLCDGFETNLVLSETTTDCDEILKDREIIVREADKTKGKYYPQATREKCMKPSSVYVSYNIDVSI